MLLKSIFDIASHRIKKNSQMKGDKNSALNEIMLRPLCHLRLNRKKQHSNLIFHFFDFWQYHSKSKHFVFVTCNLAGDISSILRFLFVCFSLSYMYIFCLHFLFISFSRRTCYYRFTVVFRYVISVNSRTYFVSSVIGSFDIISSSGRIHFFSLSQCIFLVFVLFSLLLFVLLSVVIPSRRWKI